VYCARLSSASISSDESLSANFSCSRYDLTPFKSKFSFHLSKMSELFQMVLSPMNSISIAIFFRIDAIYLYYQESKISDKLQRLEEAKKGREEIEKRFPRLNTTGAVFRSSADSRHAHATNGQENTGPVAKAGILKIK
jgi:hypothetical protein